MFQTSAWHFCHQTSSCIIPFHDSFFVFFDVFLILHSYKSGFLESLKSDFPEAFSSTAWIASRHPWWSFRLSPAAKRMERVGRGGLIRNNFSSSGDLFFFSKHESCFHGKKRPGHSWVSIGNDDFWPDPLPCLKLRSIQWHWEIQLLGVELLPMSLNSWNGFCTQMTG